MNNFIIVDKQANATKEKKEYIESELYKIFVKYF